jgi:ABC-type transporter MlaC component
MFRPQRRSKMLGSNVMILTSLVMAMALNMAAMKGDPQDDARKALNNCLVKEHNEAVKAKKSGSEFNEQVAAACVDTRKTFFDLIVRAEMGFKSKKADAEQYANEEIQAVVDSITTQFGDNVSTGAQLQPEK